VQVRSARPHGPADQIGHQAIAQAALGDLQLLDAQPPHDALADRGPGVDDVAALLVDAPFAPLA